MTIEINNRLYNDFVIWAKANNMSDNDITKYIEKAFRDKFNFDKYGDLNEKLHRKQEPEPINELKNEQINEDINEDVNEVVSEDKTEEIKPVKPKRKTKVIASR